MRLRNDKGSIDVVKNSINYIDNPINYKGTWKNVFGNNNPIYLELGMGKGKFIIENAIKNPNINYIGIDKYKTLLAKAIKNIKKDIPNLRLISMDISNINDIFDKEIDLIYLNFSDPWPKIRHEKRRLTNNVFLIKYDLIFRNKKSIIMKTDNRKLFEYSIISLSNYGYILKNISLDLHSDEDNIITTEYEDKFVLKGNVIYKLECEK